MATTVDSPHAVVRGSVTTCTYKAAVPSKSVIIEYDTAASPTTFAADKSVIEQREGVTTTSIQGLGTRHTRSRCDRPGMRSTPWSALHGTLETIVTGTSQPGEVELLAEEIIYLINQHDASTTTTSKPAG